MNLRGDTIIRTYCRKKLFLTKKGKNLKLHMETQNQGCIKQTLIKKELLKMSESHISSHITEL